METHGYHWTLLDMAGLTVTNRIALESVILHPEEETDEVCIGEYLIGSSCGVVGLMSNE